MLKNPVTPTEFFFSVKLCLYGYLHVTDFSRLTHNSYWSLCALYIHSVTVSRSESLRGWEVLLSKDLRCYTITFSPALRVWC